MFSFGNNKKNIKRREKSSVSLILDAMLAVVVDCFLLIRLIGFVKAGFPCFISGICLIGILCMTGVFVMAVISLGKIKEKGFGQI